MFLTQICWSCQKETRLTAPDFRCEHCQTVNMPEVVKTEDGIDLTDLNLSVEPITEGKMGENQNKIEPEVIVIQAPNESNVPLLSNDLGRVSIKHLIKLDKPPKAPSITETPTLEPVKKTPIAPPPIQEEITLNLDNQEQGTSLLEMPTLKPIEPQPKIPILNDFSLEDVRSIVIKDIEPNLEELKIEVNVDTTPPPIKKVENKVVEKQGKEPLAWLILYTENKEPVYYELFEGDNVFGRADAKNPVDIELIGDHFVSRAHAYIRIALQLSGFYRYSLKDDGSKRNPVTPSLNGTYVNGNPKRIPPTIEYPLQEGDTIQVGETKLVFKTKEISLNLNSAVKEVLDSQYIRTVEVGKS